jgi:hypothetical protein
LLSYKEEDPPTKKQASLPMCVFEDLLQNTNNELEEAVGELTNGALFFAMRSCEYSSVTEKNPRTKRLRVRNIAFYNKRGKKITNKRKFKTAHRVTITFENQKNGEKMESVTRTRGDRNSMFRPVKIWAKIVNRILAYDGTGPDTFVNVVCVNGKLREITAATIGTIIKNSVDKIGTDHLGFTRHDVGTHSIRTSFATLLSLQHVDIHTIKRQGRWKSDSVFKYIRTDIMAPETITLALQHTKNHNIIKLTNTR